jgi:putative oxidoreductase
MNNPLNPLLDTLSRPMEVTGRILLGLYFLIPGLTKVTGFAGMTLLINVFMHDFWNDYPGGNPQHELQNFIKNLGIFAGLLLLAGRQAARVDENV